MTNLITNPTFEANTSGWTIRNGDADAVIDSTYAYSGTKALKVSSNSANTNDVFAVQESAARAVTPGQTYTVSWYARSAGASNRTTYCYVYFYDGASVEISSTASTTVAIGNTAWTRKSFTFTVPAGAVTMKVAIYFRDSTQAVMTVGDTYYLDAVMLETGSTLNTYYDGGTPGYAWDGVPHASTSSVAVAFPAVAAGPNNMKLEVEVPPTGLQNLLSNPSGDLGTSGWISPIASTIISTGNFGGTQNLRATANTTAATYYQSEAVSVAAGNSVSGRLEVVTRSAAGIRLKVQVDFYDTNSVYLSSSPTSAELGTGVYFIPAFTAPASSASMRLRIAQMRTGTSVPVSGDQFQWRQSMLVKGATAAAITQTRTNLFTNPSFETNVSGWTGINATVSRSTAQKTVGLSSAFLQDTPGDGMTASTLAMRTPYGAVGVPVSGGKAYTLQMQMRATAANRRGFYGITWYKNNGTVSSTSTSPKTALTNGAWVSVTWTVTSPSDAAFATVFVYYETTSNTGTIPNAEGCYIDAMMMEEGSTAGTYFDGDTTDLATITYSWTGTAHASKSTAVTSAAASFDFAEPKDWRDILGPTHEIKVTRGALDAGLMSATILDSGLDPATTTHIRPGKSVRLWAYDEIAAKWEQLFEGIITNGNVSYPKTGTRIELTASDNIMRLANQSEANGVATIANLPYILEGKRVPYLVNGSAAQVSTASVVSLNADASVLDQIAITRDSVLGYAWVDRKNWLVANDAAQMNNTPVRYFTDQQSNLQDYYSYSDIDVSFNTESCINDVSITWLRTVGGETTEIAYGPYKDLTSIATWGARSASFTIHGTSENASTIQSYANSILAANGTPVIRANSITVPIKDTKGMHCAYVDLYDAVSVSYADKLSGQVYRVTGIEHNITPGKWLMTLDFSTTTQVASPTVTPSPPSAGVVNPYGYVYKTGAATIPNSAWEAVVYGTVGNADNITYNSSLGRFTVIRPGRYEVVFHIGYDNNSAGRREFRVLKNGTALFKDVATPGSALGISMTVAGIIKCVEGDTLESQTWQNSGVTGGLPLTADQTLNYATVTWLGD